MPNVRRKPVPPFLTPYPFTIIIVSQKRHTMPYQTSNEETLKKLFPVPGGFVTRITSILVPPSILSAKYFTSHKPISILIGARVS